MGVVICILGVAIDCPRPAPICVWLLAGPRQCTNANCPFCNRIHCVDVLNFFVQLNFPRSPWEFLTSPPPPPVDRGARKPQRQTHNDARGEGERTLRGLLFFSEVSTFDEREGSARASDILFPFSGFVPSLFAHLFFYFSYLHFYVLSPGPRASMNTSIPSSAMKFIPMNDRYRRFFTRSIFNGLQCVLWFIIMASVA